MDQDVRRFTRLGRWTLTFQLSEDRKMHIDCAMPWLVIMIELRSTIDEPRRLQHAVQVMDLRVEQPRVASLANTDHYCGAYVYDEARNPTFTL